jgi:hypothetical protein
MIDGDWERERPRERAAVVTFIPRVPVGSIKFNWILTTTTTTTWPPPPLLVRELYSIYARRLASVCVCVCRTELLLLLLSLSYTARTVFTRNYLGKPSLHRRDIYTYNRHTIFAAAVTWRNAIATAPPLMVR